MKTKHSIISTLLAGTLLAMSGSASAAVIWTGTERSQTGRYWCS